MGLGGRILVHYLLNFALLDHPLELGTERSHSCAGLELVASLLRVGTDDAFTKR